MYGPNIVPLILACVTTGVTVWHLAGAEYLTSRWIKNPLIISPSDVAPTAPRFAYAQYATDLTYFCNTLINAHRLDVLGSPHDLVIMYPDTWNLKSNASAEQQALAYAHRRIPRLHTIPVPMLSTSKGESTWKDSITKLNVFNLTQYDRVVYFDSDALVQNHLDDLFHAPSARLAIPRAYWLNNLADPASPSARAPMLTSLMFLLQPHTYTYKQVVDESRRSRDFDMEIVNHLFQSSAMVLPHRGLILLSGEFRNEDHSRYLSGEPDESWDPAKEFNTSRIVHFSDWPVPKPWLRNDYLMLKHQPACEGHDDDDRSEACMDRRIWWALYDEYARDRAEICDGQW